MSYCDFNPGDEVVCVRADGEYSSLCLVVGQSYFVDRVVSPDFEGDAGVVLCPAEGADLSGIWKHYLFRKVQRRDIGKWLEQSVGNTDRLDKTVKGPAKHREDA